MQTPTASGSTCGGTPSHRKALAPRSTSRQLVMPMSRSRSGIGFMGGNCLVSRSSDMRKLLREVNDHGVQPLVPPALPVGVGHHQMCHARCADFVVHSHPDPEVAVVTDVGHDVVLHLPHEQGLPAV